MNKIALRFFFFFFLAATFCNGQIKILKLNGKMKDAKQYEVKGEWIFYKTPDSLDHRIHKFFLWNKVWPRNKLKKIDKFDVFSAINPDGTEEIVYDPDTIFEGDPSVEWVRKYIKGEQYGMMHYDKYTNKIAAVLIGGGFAYFSYYGPIGVFIYSMGRNIVKPRIPYSDSIEPAVFNTEEFQLGYRKYVRNKRIKESLIFGGIGFAVGFAAFAVFK